MSWLRVLKADAESGRRLRAAIVALRRRASAELAAEGLPASRLRHELSLAMRYVGQSYELLVPASTHAPARILAAFHDAHRRRFGHADESRPVEAVTLRLRALLPAPTLELNAAAPAGGPAKLGSVEAYFDRPRRTALYDRDRLRPGDRLRGPAVVTQMDATTVIPPGWSGEVDGRGNLLLIGVGDRSTGHRS
jgi:N-methylhydantoinase A